MLSSLFTTRNKFRAVKTIGYAARTSGSALVLSVFDLPVLHANHVAIEIFYCGISRASGFCTLPLGQGVVGRIIETGCAVTRFRVGDSVAAWHPDTDMAESYVKHWVVEDQCVQSIPGDLDLSRIAPLLLNSTSNDWASNRAESSGLLTSISRLPHCEFIRVEDINQIFERNENWKVATHWIIDMQASLNDALEADWAIPSR